MKITLVDEQTIELAGSQESLTIDAPTPDRHYSPFDMLASGLATCTYAVLASWGEQAKIDVSDLKIRVSWTHHAESHRVEKISMSLLWPSLPQERRQAATRAASLCSIHKTLTTPPDIDIEVAS